MKYGGSSNEGDPRGRGKRSQLRLDLQKVSRTNILIVGRQPMGAWRQKYVGRENNGWSRLA